ncbi:hypothetical protein [Methylovirgula sp. HY1]|uniref:hypothetical protein n=1 Tax=Methylovirgula sp. HY1 TaxID=2822761 RepID=UPI001C5AE4E6|nr:hypothetical protein [Methylovirgula sp. HY1]QXX74224.1 hypothetical protein MHY1_01034 [Methylovirgula sp. HY1]
MKILNSPADLAALKGTPDYASALQILLGSTMTWVNQAAVGQPANWQLVTVLSTIQKMGFLTVADLLAECTAAGVVAPPTPPMPPNPPAPPPPTYTFLQFMAFFTSAEQAAIFASSDTQTKIFITMAAGSGGLQLSNTEVIAGIDYLASGSTATPPGPSLITAARAAAILSGQAP